jgi:hypothetical protein
MENQMRCRRQELMTFADQKPESARSTSSPALTRRTSSAETAGQLVDEPAGAARGVGRAGARADMQHLAGIGPGRQQRMVAKLTGVAVGGAALVVAVDLTDGGVHIDGHRPIAGAGTRGPCPGQDGFGDAVELTNVPEGEPAQERP